MLCNKAALLAVAGSAAVSTLSSAVLAVKADYNVPRQLQSDTAESVGCFQEDNDNRVMPFEHYFSTDRMTREVCTSACSSICAPFMALTWGNLCFCGFGAEADYTVLGEGTCNKQCDGDPSSYCGGYDSIDLFSLGDCTSSGDGDNTDESSSAPVSAEPLNEDEDPTPASTSALPVDSSTTDTCGSTLSERLRTTTLSTLDAAASAEASPVVMAPRDDGTSFLVWSDGVTVKLATLTSGDTLGQLLPDISAHAVHDALITEGGDLVLVLVWEDPDVYSATYCTDSQPCSSMDVAAFDEAGASVWRTTITNKMRADQIYSRFIWWYNHAGRLATDGSTIGAYFSVAGGFEGDDGSVEHHQGDSLKYLDAATGEVLDGGYDWGCSHSFSLRITYGQEWAALCHGDTYPNSMRVARYDTPTSSQESLEFLSGTDYQTRANGGMVPAEDGYNWLNYITNGSLMLGKVPADGDELEDVTSITQATNVDTVYPFRPYMASYGEGKLLMGWKSGGVLMLAVANAADGSIEEGPVETDMKIDMFQDFNTAPNGDVVFAFSTGTGGITVNRVIAPC